MLDFSKIQKILEEELGTAIYHARILQIATLLDRLDMDREGGAEELIVKEIVDRITGKSRYIKKKDMLDAMFINSIEEMDYRLGDRKEEKICAEKIQDFINLGSVDVNHQERRMLKDKIDQIREIEKEVNTGKKLTEIIIGKQVANDWLSDVIGKLKIGDSKFIKEKVEKIRKINKKNHRSGTATDLIKKVVTKNDLKNMSSREICEKYEFDYNGTNRKFISRLKLRSEIA